MSFITVDLDSTLADTRHRQYMVDRVNGTDWAAYSNACANDGLIMATAALVRSVYPWTKVHYVTGRLESSRNATQQWLDKYNLPCDGLWMDEATGAEPEGWTHAQYKLRRVQQVIEAVGDDMPHLFHIDDWADVKVALEDEGIPCLCVRAPHEIDAFMLEQNEGPK